MTRSIDKFVDKISPYKQINIDKQVDKLKQKVIKSVKVNGSNLNAFNIEDIYEYMCDANRFEKEYSWALTHILQKEFGTYAISDVVDLFGPGGEKRLTAGWQKLSAAEMPKALDELIINIKKLSKIAFPELYTLQNYKKLMNSKGDKFFQELANSFETMPSLLKNGNEIDVKNFVKACKTLSSSYPGIANGKQIDEQALKNYIGNLPSIIGSAIWENITAQARTLVLDRYFKEIENPIRDSIIKSGGKIITTYKQTGSNTNASGQSGIADSLVTMKLVDKKGSVIFEITVADSTKFSQSINKKYFIEETENYEEKPLGHWLKKLRVFSYWNKRMKAFLRHKSNNKEETESATFKNTDIENWNNTREAMYLLTAYDVLAIRAGGIQPATFLSLNNETATISNFIVRYAKNKRSGIGGYIQRIDRLSGGEFSNYEDYIEKQKSISHGTTDKDEVLLNKNAQNYIKLMDTKIKISINAFGGF